MLVRWVGLVFVWSVGRIAICFIDAAHVAAYSARMMASHSLERHTRVPNVCVYECAAPVYVCDAGRATITCDGDKLSNLQHGGTSLCVCDVCVGVLGVCVWFECVHKASRD